MIRVTPLMLSIEISVLIGLILAWVGVLMYHVSYDLPAGYMVGKVYTMDAIAYRVESMTDVQLYLSVSGIALGGLGSIVGLFAVGSHQVHTWIGLMFGLALAGTAWYLMMIEGRDALEAAKSSGKDDFSGPVVSYAVITCLALVLVIRNIHRVEYKSMKKIWLVKFLAATSFVVSQIYFFAMVYCQYIFGIVVLSFFPALVIGAFIVGRWPAKNDDKDIAEKEQLIIDTV